MRLLGTVWKAVDNIFSRIILKAVSAIDRVEIEAGVYGIGINKFVDPQLLPDGGLDVEGDFLSDFSPEFNDLKTIANIDDTNLPNIIGIATKATEQGTFPWGSETAYIIINFTSKDG